MKKYFVVSLVKNGLIGGGISADSEAITYRTGKVTIPQEYRHLVMKYEDICEVSSEWLFVLPTVTVKMRNGKRPLPVWESHPPLLHMNKGCFWGFRRHGRSGWRRL